MALGCPTMLTTAFTDLVGCQVPIQQAGMGGVATPELAAAVADAGGLGMVSMVMQPADAVAAGLDALAKQTTGQVGINFLMPFLDPEAVDAAASRVRVVEFFYADPDAPWLTGCTRAAPWRPGRWARPPRPARPWTPAATSSSLRAPRRAGTYAAG
jgi:nitronate monooxygenase